jgi:hypothetical protein
MLEQRSFPIAPLDKKIYVVGIVEDNQPFPRRLAQPAPEQGIDVRLGVQTPWDAQQLGDVAHALLVSGCVASMNPQNPCVGRRLSHSIAVLDGYLRFAVDASAGMDWPLMMSAMPTMPSIPHTSESHQRQPCGWFSEAGGDLCCYFRTRDKVGITSVWNIGRRLRRCLGSCCPSASVSVQSDSVLVIISRFAYRVQRANW